jgi:hypothetical protein
MNHHIHVSLSLTKDHNESEVAHAFLETQIQQVQKFIEQYVRLNYASAHFHFQTKTIDDSRMPTGFWPYFSVNVVPENNEIQSDLLMFLLQVHDQFMPLPVFPETISVSALIGVPSSIDTLKFYDAWYESVKQFFPSITIDTVSFVPMDVPHIIQAIMITGINGIQKDSITMGIQGIGVALFIAQAGGVNVESN